MGVTFWVQDAIKPAIIRQATNLYVKKASIPVEYTSYIIDGALVVFEFSSLMMLFMILGMLCDCCCPKKKPVQKSDIQVKEQSPVFFSEGKKNKGKNKKGKNRRASSVN